MTRKTLLAAATVAATIAAFPAAAGAATVTVTAPNLTVAGDATDETITIADAGGFITVDGVATTAPADNTFDLTVNAGAGADTIVVNTANLRGVTLNGDAGNDTITGNADNDIINGGNDLDTLNGGAGNDRISGNDANDTMNGDAGNDVMVWNPGDDDDVMNGGAGGGDDAELNGGNGPETFSATPLAGGRVKFERLSAAAFNLNVSPANDTERLVLNGNGGDDTMTSDPAVTHAMLLNGGTGLDTLGSGGGADFINGGDDNDALSGGPGIDRLVGDRGGDSMDGGSEDDTLVWNNGDGSDTMDGQAGLDKIEVNGAAGAGDAFEIAPNGVRARFDRVNLVPFRLDIGTSEALDVRGQGGDDTFLAKSGTPLAVLADGGAGNDALTGAEEPDTFLGGIGNDTITGGAGNDLLDGQDGDDRLLAHDDAGDLVRGGAGNDFAEADSPRVDAVVDVETIDRPAADDEIATAVDVRTKNAGLAIKNGRKSTKISLRCPAAEAGGCTGRLTLLSAKTFKVRGAKVRLVLGSARFDLSPGETKKITVRLPNGIKALAKNGKVALLAQTASRDAAGNLAQDSAKVLLRT
jgi:Ca2+-binding RTX toxin-like protein